MKIKNTSIGTLLTLGFSIIIFLVIIMGVNSFNQAGRLWQNTDDLYNHPLIVGRAVRDIESYILQIHILMKEISLEDELTENQINRYEAEINSYEIELYKMFDIVYDRYLGPKSEIDTVYNYIKKWKPLREKVITLRLNSGRLASSLQHRNVNMPFVAEMITASEKLITFSNEKAIEFYTHAEAEKARLGTRLLILIVIIFISSAFILYFLIKTITSPLKKLSDIADRLRKGDYEARSDYNSNNEIGTLASSLNRMASSLQDDIINNESVTSVSKLMMGENELGPFSRELLKTLISRTNSQMAALYFLNKANGFFEHFESIGLTENRVAAFSSKSAEGEFGVALGTKKITRITDIHDNTQFSFSTVSGNFKPREIITIPVIDGDEVVAIISLASLKIYSDSTIRFLNEIWFTLTARIRGVLSFQRISDFSEKLGIQNIELEQKSKELVMQSDELKEYNIELEIQKKQLNEVSKLKSEFLSNMSHELRTPLNSVIALSGVLNRRLKGKIPVDEYNYLGIIEKNGSNLLTLINNILDLSRIEAGKEELTFTRFSMCDIVHDILSSLDPIIIEKGLTVSCITPPDLPMILSDRNMCHHIMQNIISNAVKFTEAGSIEITASVNDDELQISVKDTGIGVPEEFIPFIFDEFRQADNSTSRKFGGTGLGLAIVKKYCNLLNGTVNVKSKPGIGSVFTLVLPLKPSGIYLEEAQLLYKYAAGSSNTESLVKRSEGERKTILLVEDSEPQIIQLTDILKDEGYILNIARNGKEALDSVKLNIPDAMILDLMMPEVDGFEVLREIRSLKATKSIPVLILTAKHITKSDLSFLKENHIHQLIQKGSLNRRELLNQINKIFSAGESMAKEKNENIQKVINPNGKPRIVVIEDNPDSVVTLKALLGRNYELEFADDGTQGLQKIDSDKPDLVLLDISLPDMDGFMVFDEIKKNKDLSGVKVVALTARAMKGDREDLLSYGFDGYISKPIDNETFEKIIKEFISNRQH